MFEIIVVLTYVLSSEHSTGKVFLALLYQTVITENYTAVWD
jgi:hypothetical protein